MNVEQNTGNTARLSLPERAARGLLATETEISLPELLALEHPTDPVARRALGAAIRAAIQYGDLEAREQRQRREVRRKISPWFHPEGTWSLGAGDPPSKVVTDVSVSVSWWIEREAYRRWRAQCPASLLSRLTRVNKWLGATPALAATLPVETSLPESPASAARLTDSQQDKQDCQAIARELWAEQPNATQADLLKNSRIKSYRNKWPGENTVPGWLSAVDPRPKEQRRGRPKAR